MHVRHSKSLPNTDRKGVCHDCLEYHDILVRFPPRCGGHDLSQHVKKVISGGYIRFAWPEQVLDLLELVEAGDRNVSHTDLLLQNFEARGSSEGQVALITSIRGFGSLDQRGKGFDKEIAAKYPGLKLVADGMPATGLNIMTNLTTANPDLRGVFPQT